MFDEGFIGALGNNFIWMYGYYKLNRVNGEQYVFLVNIMNNNHNFFNMTIDLVLFDDVNCRLSGFVGCIWSVVDLKTNVLKDRMNPLSTFCG